MENKKMIIATIAFLTVMLSVAIAVPGHATTPSIFIDPLSYSASAAGSSFTVNVNVSDASGVAGYGVNVQFDPAILVVTGWTSGGFLETSGIQTLGINAGNYSNLGYVSLGDTLSAQGSATGSGTLIEITFKVLGGGRCALHLYGTSLLDEANQGISHTDTDGLFLYNYVSLTPNNGTGAYMIQGFGFGQNATINSVTWNGTELPLMPTKCNVEGNFVTVGTVPNGSTPGNYTISVLDSSGNRQGATFTLLGVTGPQGAQGPKGDTGAQGIQGPAGAGGSDSYAWAALALSIIAIIIGIYALARKKS